MSTIVEPSEMTASGPSAAPLVSVGAAKALWSRLDWPTLLPFAGSLALLIALAWRVLGNWYQEYTSPEGYYGHAFLIPFLVGLMLWHRRAALRAVPKQPCPAALWVLIPALALLVVTVKSYDMNALMSWAFLLVICSGVWFTLGSAFLRAAAFPLAFLWLMAPLPTPLLNDATLNMQMLSTVGAGKLLHFMALHPVQQGNLIHLDHYTLNVDVPCSGFKLLLRLLTFSAAFAYLTDTTLAKRWLIFLFSLPLSLAVNSLRIALIGVVGECAGTTAAITFHDWSGIITLILCMAVLFSFAKGLGCRTFAGQPIF